MELSVDAGDVSLPATLDAPRDGPARAAVVALHGSDYDPEPAIARVRCPTLLFYGESDEWTPAEDSIAVWRRAAGTGDLTVHRLVGCTHLPTIGGAATLESISSDYSNAMPAWVQQRINR